MIIKKHSISLGVNDKVTCRINGQDLAVTLNNSLVLSIVNKNMFINGQPMGYISDNTGISLASNNDLITELQGVDKPEPMQLVGKILDYTTTPALSATTTDNIFAFPMMSNLEKRIDLAKKQNIIISQFPIDGVNYSLPDPDLSDDIELNINTEFIGYLYYRISDAFTLTTTNTTVIHNNYTFDRSYSFATSSSLLSRSSITSIFTTNNLIFSLKEGLTLYFYSKDGQPWHLGNEDLEGNPVYLSPVKVDPQTKSQKPTFNFKK